MRVQHNTVYSVIYYPLETTGNNKELLIDNSCKLHLITQLLTSKTKKVLLQLKANKQGKNNNKIDYYNQHHQNFFEILN